jgi:hypothetical protein
MGRPGKTAAVKELLGRSGRKNLRWRLLGVATAEGKRCGCREIEVSGADYFGVR